MTSDPQGEALAAQLRRLEQEKNSLERRAQRYKDILDTLPWPVCRLLPDGIVSYVNRACCEAVQRDAVELIGRGLLAQSGDEVRQRALGAWHKLSVDAPTVQIDCGLPPGLWLFQGIFDDQGRLEALQGSPALTAGPGAEAEAATADAGPLDHDEVSAEEVGADDRRARRVLVVDDENMVCTLAQKVLEKFGFEVVVARTGKAALTAFEAQECFDVVLLDMSLPDIDGKQVFSAMRQLRPDARVVISSGYDSASSGQRFTGPGVTFLPKPYMPDQLIGKIREMVGD